LTIENKEGIPIELREKLGSWVFGCDICQEVCPYNSRPPETPWSEFRPESGVGHYLYLPDLLDISTDEEFRKRFETTPLRRPKRRGLLRNALVVLGNELFKVSNGEQTKTVADDVVLNVVRRLKRFADAEQDPMLVEHAQWAISRYVD